jgi:CheY-like chemotaxis protein
MQTRRTKPLPDSSPDELSPKTFSGASPADGKGPAILVVEDESIVRRVVGKQLRRAGFEVYEAATAEEALALFAKGCSIRLVLTDVLMPGLNGREFVALLRVAHPSVPVLYMSGYPADVIAQKGILESGIDFIEKSDLTRVLLPKINEILNR